MYHAELNMNEARRRVVLSNLGETADGDVFYLVGLPSVVWRKNTSAYSPDYPARYVFERLGDEAWRQESEVGDPRQRVIVIHNTKENST